MRRMYATNEPSRTMRIATLFGVEIVVDWSVLIIFTLIWMSLGASLFPSWHPDWSVLLSWTVAFFAALLFLASILAHELSHALVARARKMPVRKITLHVFGGMAHLEREATSPSSELLVAVVGPLTSLTIGVLATLAGAIAIPGLIDELAPEAMVRRLDPLSTLLLWLGPVNILLAVFNLLPGFPLDGGRVFRALVWAVTKDLQKATRWACWLGRFLGWTFILLGAAMVFGFAVPFFGSGPIGGIWLLLIGWFLSNAARSSYLDIAAREQLQGVAVKDLMRSDLMSVEADTNVENFVRSFIMKSDQHSFPVRSHGSTVGVVALNDVRRTKPETWNEIRVAEIMTPLARLHTVRVDENASMALQKLADQDVNQLPVITNGEVLGFLRREDVIKWLALHQAQGEANQQRGRT